MSNTKLYSPGKIKYFGKSQLGIEQEYPVINLARECSNHGMKSPQLAEFLSFRFTEGRFNVDGFVVCFDVGMTRAQSAAETEFVGQILHHLVVRQKKPVVLATTKNDEQHRPHVKDAEKLVARKELKGERAWRNHFLFVHINEVLKHTGSVAIVETSSHRNVNVTATFMLLSQLIDRTQTNSSQATKVRTLAYPDAERAKHEKIESARSCFEHLLQDSVKESDLSWTTARNHFAAAGEFRYGFRSVCTFVCALLNSTPRA